MAHGFSLKNTEVTTFYAIEKQINGFTQHMRSFLHWTYFWHCLLWIKLQLTRANTFNNENIPSRWKATAPNIDTLYLYWFGKMTILLILAKKRVKMRLLRHVFSIFLWNILQHRESSQNGEKKCTPTRFADYYR